MGIAYPNLSMAFQNSPDDSVFDNGISFGVEALGKDIWSKRDVQNVLHVRNYVIILHACYDNVQIAAAQNTDSCV